jgi:hypothetical protein
MTGVPNVVAGAPERAIAEAFSVTDPSWTFGATNVGSGVGLVLDFEGGTALVVADV